MKPSPIRVRKPARPAQSKINKKLAELFKSLADENRLQILRLLMAGGKAIKIFPTMRCFLLSCGI